MIEVFAGDLTEFALPAVVRVLADNGKTGLLEVVTDGRPGGIELHEGGIRAASADRRRAGLARRLLGTGSVGVTTVLKVLEGDGPLRGDGRLGELLIGGSHLGADQVTEALRDHTIDAVLQMTRATGGSFRFRADVGPEDGTAHLHLAADEVLDEVARRQAGIAELSSADLQPRSVLRVVAAAAEVPVTISASAWRLLALLDGRRTVAELLDVTGGGMVDTYQQLAELLDAGVVQADRATTTQALLEDHQRLTALERAWGTEPHRDDVDPLPSSRDDAARAATTTVVAPAGDDRRATITSLPARAARRRAAAGASLDEQTLRRFVAGLEALA